jgi:hypothetical protein
VSIAQPCTQQGKYPPTQDLGTWRFTWCSPTTMPPYSNVAQRWRAPQQLPAPCLEAATAKGPPTAAQRHCITTLRRPRLADCCRCRRRHHCSCSHTCHTCQLCTLTLSTSMSISIPAGPTVCEIQPPPPAARPSRFPTAPSPPPQAPHPCTRGRSCPPPAAPPGQCHQAPPHWLHCPACCWPPPRSPCSRSSGGGSSSRPQTGRHSHQNRCDKVVGLHGFTGR